MRLIVNTDGACSGNPGPMGIGVIAWRQDAEQSISDGSVIELSEFHGHGTNNLAEYTAVVRALEECLLLGATSVQINCDSLIVVRQIQGEYKCNIPALNNARKAVLALTVKFPGGVTFQHIYDELNQRADRLARAASKRGRKAR